MKLKQENSYISGRMQGDKFALKKRAGVSSGIISAILILSLGGCASLSDGGAKLKNALPSAIKPIPAPQVSIEEFRDAPVAQSDASIAWWQKFADETLTRLVEDAKSESISLALAQSRVREARALGRSTIAGFAPRLDIGASATQTGAVSGPDLIQANGQPIDSQTTSTSFVRASWEVPLWGRLGASLAGAKANEAQAEIGLEAAKIALIGDLAASYVDLRASQLRLKYLQEDLERAETLAQISKERLRVGLISLAEESFARSAAAGVRAQIPDAILQVRAGLDRIAILRGVTPGSLDALLNSKSNFEYSFPSNAPDISEVPADFVRRRLDVRQAEQAAILQAAAVGISKADLYPSVSISGVVSLLSAVSGNPIAQSIGRSTITPSIDMPLFDLGRRRASLKVSNERFEQALLNYRQVTLGAIAEGQAALSSYAQGKERASAAVAAEIAAKQRRDATDVSLKAGIVSIKEGVEADRDYASARQTRLSSQARHTDAAIGLYRTFAGSPEIIK